MTVKSAAKSILSANVNGVAEAVTHLAGDLVDQIERLLPDAICGRPGAIGSYIAAWRELEHRTLGAVHEARPDLVAEVEDEGYVLVEVKAPMRVALDQLALHAPFSPWTESYGSGLGVVMCYVAELRAHLTESRPLVPRAPVREEPAIECGEEGVWRFFRLGLLELEAARSPLGRVADLFDLSMTELGTLFGVSRQAVSEWVEEGVPAGRAAKANALGRIADVLERNLRPERVPGIVRQPADAYDGLTMLEMIARDRHEELLELVSDTFEWAKAA